MRWGAAKMSGCSECAAYGSDRLQLNYSDRRSLPPWRGEHVKFAHRRERVFDLAVIGLIQSFLCALSSAFLGDHMFSFGGTWCNPCGRSHRDTRNNHGVRGHCTCRVSESFGFSLFCAFSFQYARVGLRVDADVLPLGYVFCNGKPEIHALVDT